MTTQQTANYVDQIERSSSPNLTGSNDRRVLRMPLRETITREHPEMGQMALHRTHQRTITLHVVFITGKRQTGFFKAVYTKNGSQQVCSCGSTENVCLILFSC